MNENKTDDDLYIQAMFGPNAVHCALNFIVQNMGGGKILVVAQTQDPRFQKLLRNSKKTHQLVLGDVVIRPRIIVESNHLRGDGISGIARSGFEMDEWIENGKVLLGKSE